MPDIQTIVLKIAEIVKREVDVKYRMFLFGSRVDDSHHPKADIDIGILADQPIDSKKFANIREEIDRIPTLLKIDFVDFSSVSREFRQIALQKTRDITPIDRKM